MGGICEFISLVLSSILCWFTNGFILGSNVYTILQAQGLTVSGGRVHGVGVGGYLLGGGFSHLTGDVREFYWRGSIQTTALTLIHLET